MSNRNYPTRKRTEAGKAETLARRKQRAYKRGALRITSKGGRER